MTVPASFVAPCQTVYNEQFSDGVVEAKCADGVCLSDGHVITLEPPRAPAGALADASR
jgi:hypothetical protein